MKYIMMCVLALGLHGSAHAMLKENHKSSAKEKIIGADWPKISAGSTIRVDSFEDLTTAKQWLLPGVHVYSRELNATYVSVSDEICMQKKENNENASGDMLQRMVKLKCTRYSYGIPMEHRYIERRAAITVLSGDNHQLIAIRGGNYRTESGLGEHLFEIGCSIIALAVTYKLLSWVFTKKST